MRWGGVRCRGVPKGIVKAAGPNGSQCSPSFKYFGRTGVKSIPVSILDGEGEKLLHSRSNYTYGFQSNFDRSRGKQYKTKNGKPIRNISLNKDGGRRS